MKNYLTPLNAGKRRFDAFLVGALSLAPLTVHAQKSSDDDGVFELDAYVVESYSDSLRESIHAKRDSTEVADMVLSEDIGKFPDSNVAEALQRITGVQINRTDGEGSYVAVRGVEPDLNLVMIDGAIASSGGFERAFDFSTLSSDLVSGLRVIKSQSADLVEGGVGAVIKVQTPNPLNFKSDRTIRFSTEGSYSSMTSDWSPKYTGLYSQTFAEGKLGALFSFSYEDRAQRTDQVGTNGWVRLAVPGEQDNFIPRFVNVSSNFTEQKRTGLTGAVQYRPSENLEFILKLRSNEYETSQERNGFNTRPLENNLSGFVFNEDNTAISYSGPSFNYGALPIQTYNVRLSTSDSAVLTAKWKASDRVDVDFGYDVSSSENDSNPNGLVDVRYYLANDPDEGIRRTVSYAMNPGGVPEISMVGDTTDSSNWTFRQYNLNRNISTTDTKAVYADLDFDTGGNLFNLFETGLRLSTQEAAKPYQAGERYVNLGLPIPDDAVVPFPVDDFLGDVDGDIYREWMVVDQERAVEVLYESGNEFPGLDDLTENLQNQGAIEEKVTAAYAKMNFSHYFRETSLTGNFGVRFARTDITVDGYGQNGDGVWVPSQVKRSYNDLLPSFTFVAKPKQDLILRFAGASVMTRPKLQDLSISRSVQPERVPPSINNGNPYLDPYRADTLDLSAEWYIDESSLLSVALFYKDIESLIATGTEDVIFEEYMAPGTALIPGEEVRLTSPANMPGDTLEGFELNFQKQFKNMAAPFNNMGVNANYTYTKSGLGVRNEAFVDQDAALEDGTYPTSAYTLYPLAGNSKHSYNLGAFYENEKFFLRLAYNWRDRYLSNALGFQNTPEFTEEYGQWDGRFSWTINEFVTFNLDGINLTDETNYSFYALQLGANNPDSTERFSSYQQTGRKVNASFSFAF
ncbi:TonB-dependent receptor [Pelagicoccus sp. SDUM812005]|uniref:TonB-dependent receptor n=1 Tax=Pelagicoccus sp. SDUM812005 TaxID=3041257 RepID=UPI00280C6813|nr:TonB-dependent receptor [Pelagicoccus sp. SDUM812005]MDQ8180257.1 TonB-dependent receptor [Pelagicoccus sp. SDUM812005]